MCGGKSMCPPGATEETPCPRNGRALQGNALCVCTENFYAITDVFSASNATAAGWNGMVCEKLGAGLQQSFHGSQVRGCPDSAQVSALFLERNISWLAEGSVTWCDDLNATNAADCGVECVGLLRTREGHWAHRETFVARLKGMLRQRLDGRRSVEFTRSGDAVPGKVEYLEEHLVELCPGPAQEPYKGPCSPLGTGGWTDCGGADGGNEGPLCAVCKADGRYKQDERRLCTRCQEPVSLSLLKSVSVVCGVVTLLAITWRVRGRLARATIRYRAANKFLEDSMVCMQTRTCT